MSTAQMSTVPMLAREAAEYWQPTFDQLRENFQPGFTEQAQFYKGTHERYFGESLSNRH